MNKLEKEFKDLVCFLKENKEEELQKSLKICTEKEVPENYRRALRFYQSLSGDSKTFLYKVTIQEKCKKKKFFSPNKNHQRVPIKATNSVSYIPK